MIWLLRMSGVPMTRIAVAFDLSPERVRQIVYKTNYRIERARRQNLSDAPFIRRLIAAGTIGIGAHQRGSAWAIPWSDVELPPAT